MHVLIGLSLNFLSNVAIIVTAWKVADVVISLDANSTCARYLRFLCIRLSLFGIDAQKVAQLETGLLSVVAMALLQILFLLTSVLGIW